MDRYVNYSRELMLMKMGMFDDFQISMVNSIQVVKFVILDQENEIILSIEIVLIFLPKFIEKVVVLFLNEVIQSKARDPTR